MQRPVEARGDLLDMGRFAGAVIALDHDPAVEGEAGEDRQRRVVVEAIGVVDIGDVFARLAERRDLQSLSMPKVWRTEIVMSGLSEREPAGGCRWLSGWHSFRAS